MPEPRRSKSRVSTPFVSFARGEGQFQMMQSRLAVGGAVVWLLVMAVATSADAQTRVPEQRYFVSIDGGGQSGSQQLQDLGEAGELFGEPILLDTSYNIDRSGGMFRGTATMLLRRRLGIGVGFTRTTSTGDAGVTVQAPHPIFLNRPRLVSQALTALGHRESMVHLHAAWVVQLDERAHLQLFGGPTLMRLEQAVVTDASLVEVGFPFSEVNLSRVTVMEMNERGVGFNVGADFAYMLAPFWGLGGFVQYAGGSIDLPLPSGQTSITVGGLQFGGGLRFRF